MKPNPFFLLSVFLAVVALGFQITARDRLDKGSHLRVKIIEAAIMHVKVERDPEAARYCASARTMRNLGFAFTLFGIVSFIAARYRHERGWYLILTGLLFLGIFTRMLL